MPSEFLGHRIANDAASIAERSQSPTGFILSDVPLLEYMKIIDKKGGRQQISTNLGSTPQEIRDFLSWVTGDKKPPLPPLARKILCLKRALIKSSIANTGVSPQKRTGEIRQLEELEALLKSHGVKDMDNKEACITQGSVFQPVIPELPVPSAPSVSPSPSISGPGCQTSVSCDNSALVALIGEIKSSLTRIESMAPMGALGKQSESISATQFETIKEQISGIDKSIQQLSAANGLSVKGPGSVRSVASNPVSIAESAVNAASKNDAEGVQQFLSELDDNISIMKGFSNDQIDIVKTKLEALKESKPIFGQQVDAIVNRIELLGDITPKVNLSPILDAIKAIPPSPSINAATSAIENLKTNLNPVELRSNLTRVKSLLESTDEDPRQVAVVETIDRVLSGIREHSDETKGRLNSVNSTLAELKNAVGPVASLQPLLTDIQTHVSDGSSHKAILEELAVVRQAVEGLQRPSDEIAQLVGKIETIETALGKVTEGVLVTSLRQINDTLIDATARIAGLPISFNSILTDVIAQIQPLLQSAQTEIIEQLRLIKQDTEMIDMKVDALDKLGKNTKESVSGIHDQLREQRDVLQALRSEISELKGTVSSSCSNGPLVEQIAALSEHIHGLRSLVDATRCKDLSFEPILTAIQSSMGQISTEIGSLQRTNANNRHNGLIAQKEALRTQVEELQQSLLEIQTHALTTTNELDNKREALEQAEQELSRLRMESPKKNGLISELQAREKEKNGKVIELEARIREMSEDIARIESECTEERETATKTLAILTDEKRILEERISAKETELAKLSDRITDLSANQATLGAEREEKERLRAMIADLERRADESDAAEQSVSAELETKRAQLEEANAKIRGLEISAMNIGAKEAVEAEKRDLEAKLTECSDSKRDLTASLEKMQSEISRKNRNIQSITKIRDDLNAQIKESALKLSARNTEYTNKLRALNEKHTEDVSNAYQSAITDMEQELELLRDSCAKSAKQHLVEIKSLKEQLAKSGSNVLVEKNKQIADLTLRCEQLKAEALANSKSMFDAKEAELRNEFLAKNKEKSDEITRLLSEHATLVAEKDAEIAQLRGQLEQKAHYEEELEARVKSSANPPETAMVPPPISAAPPIRKEYKKTDLYLGLMNAMKRDNKGKHDDAYMSYIDNLYWGYKTPDADFAHTKREIDRVLNSNWIASIKREMEQYKNLLNEKEFKLYIEKFFDILMRYLNPVTPDVPATRLAPAYTRRYGRGGAERKSKRKTRKNRK